MQGGWRVWCCCEASGGTREGESRADLLGFGADSVPDRVQLTPHNVVEALEEALLQGQLTGVYLVGLAQLLDTGVHQVRDGIVYCAHGRAQTQPHLHQLQQSGFVSRRHIAAWFSSDVGSECRVKFIVHSALEKVGLFIPCNTSHACDRAAARSAQRDYHGSW